MGLHEIQKFLHNKRNGDQIEKAAPEWKKIFASYTSDKGVTIKKLNSQKFNDTMKKWAKELNRAFSKEEVQIAKTVHEEIFIIPGHKGNEIKTTLKSHLTPVRMASIKNINNNKRWQECGEKGTLIHCWN
jgi:hypothetical protein